MSVQREIDQVITEMEEILQNQTANEANPAPYRCTLRHIVLSIIEGRDLKVADVLSQSSDPFCVVQIGSVSVQTSVIKRDINPRWDQRFEITVRDEELVDGIITINCFDWNKTTPPDPIGSVSLSVREPFEGFVEVAMA